MNLKFVLYCLFIALDYHQRVLTTSRNLGHAALFGYWLRNAVIYRVNDVQQSRTRNQECYSVPIFIGFARFSRDVIVTSLGIFIVSPRINGPSVRDCKARSFA